MREMLDKLKNKKILFTLIIIFLIIAVIIVVALGLDVKNEFKEETKSENQSTKEEKKETSIDATKEYYCPEGFTLSGTVCNVSVKKFRIN